MILRVLFHLMIVRFFFNFLAFFVKLAFAALIVICLQIRVGNTSLEKHLEGWLKNSRLAVWMQTQFHIEPWKGNAHALSPTAEELPAEETAPPENPSHAPPPGKKDIKDI